MAKRKSPKKSAPIKAQGEKRGKVKPWTRRYVLFSKKTGRAVSAAYAKRYPRRIKRKAVYYSRITGRRVSKSKISNVWSVQALRELHPRVTVAGARKQVRALKEFAGLNREELQALPQNYDRWFQYLQKNSPELLPPNLRDPDDDTADVEI